MLFGNKRQSKISKGNIMFLKYASNVLQELSDECTLKSYACKNSDDAELYRSIATRIDWIITKIGKVDVEEDEKEPLKKR